MDLVTVEDAIAAFERIRIASRARPRLSAAQGS